MSEVITQEFIEKNLLCETGILFEYIYWVEQEFDVEPSKKAHRKTSIKYNDLKERRDDFLSELITTVVDWVYSKEESKKITDERIARSPNSTAQASAFLAQQANKKFRQNHPQGQFGELLLFNFIQHFFKAAPILRKQSITTTTGHERFGGDAIHYKKDGDKNVIIIGESKCYESKYQFSAAFKRSLDSIVNSFDKLDSELDLYVYDGFIDSKLSDIAKQYKQGKLQNVHFELVCLVAYHEGSRPKGKDEDTIKQQILKMVEDKCKALDKNIYKAIDTAVLDRVHYIFFPVFEMDELLIDFLNRVGRKSE